MQKIVVNELLLKAPSDIANIFEVFKTLSSTLYNICRITSDINIEFINSDYLKLSFEGINYKGRAWLETEYRGDSACHYGSAAIRVIQTQDRIDEFDIKRALSLGFPNWEIELNSLSIQSAEEIIEEILNEETEYV